MTSVHSKRNPVGMKDTVISREAPLIKNKRRFCKVEGCSRIVKSQGLCQRHGAKPQKCRVVECTKQAQGGFGGMCKAHFRASQTEVLACQLISEEAQVESVSDRVIPASLSWTPRSGGPMPLVAHLKDGMDSKKPPGWHRNEERRARQQPPVAQLLTEFDDWEIELLYSESLILTGTSQLSFKYLAYGWGREVGFHVELVKSVCASRRVLLPSAKSLSAWQVNAAAVPEVGVGSTESAASSHQSDRASPHAFASSQGKEEDTLGTSSATSNEEESNWRRAQQGFGAEQQSFAGQAAEATTVDDPRATLAAMTSTLTGSESGGGDGGDWMKYGGTGQLEEVDERKPSEFQPPRSERINSISEMTDWGMTSEDWANYQFNDAEDHTGTNGGSSRNSGPTKFAELSSSPSQVDWVAKSGAVKLEDITEGAPSVFPRPGHHRGANYTKTPNSATSGANEQWKIGSVGNMDDLEDLDMATYCLSMQFDEVTLQNIYHEQADK